MIVTLAGVPLFSTLSSTFVQSAPQIAEKALAATVSLEMQDKNGTLLRRGSGFFVRRDLIATNYHVIRGATQGTAKLVAKETRYTIYGITAIDETNDLALLKVAVQGIKPLPLGDSNAVRIGETVYVVGNPKGLEGTFSNGIISGRRDSYMKKRLQMTAPTSPGSSGGPVLNDTGHVIGISIASYLGQEAQNLNFASHSNALKRLLARAGPVQSLRHSTSAGTYYIRGNEKVKLGDYNGAIADYTRAIRRKSDYARAYLNRGAAKADLGQHKAAITDYDTSIRLKPDYASAYLNRGIAKAKLGQHEAAIADYDAAVHFKNDLVNAYVNRGNAKVRLGQHPAAIADFSTALRFEPNCAYAYHNRGLANGKLKLHGEARQDLRTAFDLAERDGNESLKALIEKGIKIINRLDCTSQVEKNLTTDER